MKKATFSKIIKELYKYNYTNIINKKFGRQIIFKTFELSKIKYILHTTTLAHIVFLFYLFAVVSLKWIVSS